MARDRKICVRVSAEEEERFFALSSAAGFVNPAEYARTRLLSDGDSRPLADIEERLRGVENGLSKVCLEISKAGEGNSRENPGSFLSDFAEVIGGKVEEAKRETAADFIRERDRVLEAVEEAGRGSLVSFLFGLIAGAAVVRFLLR